ncbi:MAG: DinB family protein [Terracidiphilus sp.]
MRGWIRVLFFVVGMGSMAAVGQTGADAAKGPAAGTVITPAKALDSELSMTESEMLGAVKAMPEEKFGFAPTAAIFVPGQKTEFAMVRTFSQQATHVAEANYFFFSTVGGLKPDMDRSAMEKLTSKADVVAALAASFAFGRKTIATLTEANAFEVLKTPGLGLQTRATLSGLAIAHANDHYGQMVEYLRMNGIVPPASAK